MLNDATNLQLKALAKVCQNKNALAVQGQPLHGRCELR